MEKPCKLFSGYEFLRHVDYRRAKTFYFIVNKIIQMDDDFVKHLGYTFPLVEYVRYLKEYLRAKYDEALVIEETRTNWVTIVAEIRNEFFHFELDYRVVERAQFEPEIQNYLDLFCREVKKLLYIAEKLQWEFEKESFFKYWWDLNPRLVQCQSGENIYFIPLYPLNPSTEQSDNPTD